VQILELLGEVEERGIWELSSEHIQQLITAVPESQDILVCLVDDKDCRPTHEYICQRLDLAQSASPQGE